MSWHPSANALAIKSRADLYQRIRLFFSERGIIEVDTPILAATTVTDPHIESIASSNNGYLQTSPEYFMKRLLAAGASDIYQMAKVFRKEELGKKHHHEFTLLEWYRLDFDQWDLMDEVSDLIEFILGDSHFEHISYRDVFEHYLGINPHRASIEQLRAEAQEHINIVMPKASKDDWLNLLMSHLIEPYLGFDAPVFIYDYPPSQAALAKTNQDESGEQVAERFELYYRGLELANGYHELTDAEQQKARFYTDNQQRISMGLRPVAIDYDFLQALEHGLPNCAGVAVGIDRLLMVKMRAESIDEVISFR